MSLGPFDLTAGPFLTLNAILLAVTIAAGIVIPRWLRPDGRIGAVPDAARLAYLAGGPTRFAEALVAQMLSVGMIAIEKGRGLRILRHPSAGGSSAERGVLSLPTPARWSRVSDALEQDVDALEDSLVAQGLLIDRATAWQLRFWQTTPWLFLLLFEAIKLEVGTARDKPIGILTVLTVLTAVMGLLRFWAVDRRTRAGVEALDSAVRRSDRLRKAPLREETGLAVALFGTTVLAGSAFDDFHQLRSSDGGSGGGDGSSGDGGCGGGGCGGCGG